jgi:hypothetical protein
MQEACSRRCHPLAERAISDRLTLAIEAQSAVTPEAFRHGVDVQYLSRSPRGEPCRAIADRLTLAIEAQSAVTPEPEDVRR